MAKYFALDTSLSTLFGTMLVVVWLLLLRKHSNAKPCFEKKRGENVHAQKWNFMRQLPSHTHAQRGQAQTGMEDARLLVAQSTVLGASVA